MNDMVIEKPKITQKLAWVAFWLEIGWVAVSIVFIFLAYVFPASGRESVKIPVILPVMSAVGECFMLPFAWSCLRNALQKEISEKRAMGCLILPIVLYFVGAIFGFGMNFAVRYAAQLFYSVEVLGIYVMKMQYMQFLNLLPVQIASLVLICCASAVELYILKHKEFSV